MAQSDKLYNLSVLASLAQMTTEMNLNNNQRKLKQSEQDEANRKWEKEFAYKKEVDQWQKDMKLKEFNLTEQELFSEHGKNVKIDDDPGSPNFGNSYIDWDGYDVTLTPGWDITTQEKWLEKKSEFEDLHTGIALSGDDDKDKQIITDYFAGARAGAYVNNTFVIDPELYMDVDQKYYQGVDVLSMDYLGVNDFEQAKRYIDPLFNLIALNDQQRNQLVDLGLMNENDSWADVKQSVKVKWEGYKTGLLKENENFYNKKESEQRIKDNEDHIIKHQSAFLDSDLGKIAYDEYGKNLVGLQLQVNEDGSLATTEVEFFKSSTNKTKTKNIDIADYKKLHKHLKNLSPDKFQMALHYYDAKGKGLLDSTYIGMFVNDVTPTGNLKPGTNLSDLQTSMIAVGKSQEFNKFLQTVVLRKSIKDGVSQHSALFSNQDYMTEMMKERHNIATLVKVSTVGDVAFRDYITSPDYSNAEKGAAIAKVRQQWMDLGRDPALFDTYMEAFGTYTPALQVLQQQFTP